MLEIRQICKQYKTGSLVQKALDHVSLTLRDNEFVAILGPSGSGKTTLLNIIGGLDRYDSGDLVINGISTKKYRDRDWDSYRNHTIGFVFQSYNLIPHQTVLANVELALTISGVGKAERRRRAVRALEQVGLGDQLHKRPSQMSGGQMQRVAIARALINDPDILLADEPTGALDSATSLQVMELLKEVAKDRLVVMVTHNPELAARYANRIVNLKDGRIVSDSRPLEPGEASSPAPAHKTMGKASMSFLTALSLSFNNLRTKKARTILTSFAGSIGIIGIALILALSTGVNAYIESVERDTLSQYPLQIQSTGFDFASMLAVDSSGAEQSAEGDINVIEMITSMFSKMDSNDLGALKAWLESGESGMEAYTSAIEYSYDVSPQIYRTEGDGIRQVNPDRSFEALGLGSSSTSSSMMATFMGTDVFYEMPENASLYEGQYDVKAGRWPESYNECVLVLTSGGAISDFLLYTLGLRDSVELDTMVEQFINEEAIDTPEDMGAYSYEDILGITFRLVQSSDYYQYDSRYGVWKDKRDDDDYMRNLVEQGEELTIVGIVQPSADANGALLTTGIAYPASLTEYVAEKAAESEIVKSQLADRTVNVFTGEAFGESGQEDFDMNSLFSIDEEALKNAFSVDSEAIAESLEGAFDLSGLAGSLDLSGLSGLSDALPQLSSADLSDILDGVSLTFSPEALSSMTSGLLEGYARYAAENPQADFSGLGESFLSYLNTDEARGLLLASLRDILEENGAFDVSAAQVQKLFADILSGFQDYAAAGGYTDPDQFGAYLMEYLQTEEALAIIADWSDEVFPDGTELSISQEQLEGLAQSLAQGYLSYAAAGGLPDPSRMGEYFLDYLDTAEAQAVLSGGVASMIDVSGLEEQLAGALGSYSASMAQALESQITAVMEQAAAQISASVESALTQAARSLGPAIENAISIDADAFASAFTMNMDAEELSELLTSMSAAKSATYESNLSSLGYVDFDQPSGISIYPLDFESKAQVVSLLDGYNARMEAAGKPEQVITYTDMVGTLMSSVTDIVDIISYVLIAFVAISLVVSSIMIGVITYISVLERKKEIGILRAIGASKGNIAQVFNAETFIIGLTAGLIGIGLTLLLLLPINAIIHHLAGTSDISAFLPPQYAAVLIVLSVLLTLLGGLIPSRKAAKSDPVTALRTE